jgi:dethiobiotin synthetase
VHRPRNDAISGTGHYLVTGTDTSIGKTYVTTRLIKALRSRGIDCVGMKPWCSGATEDVVELRQASDLIEPEHLINPARFQVPAAPYAAAMVEGRAVDLQHVSNAFQTLASRHTMVLVEGAGGLLVPILRNYDYRDLATDWGLKAIVVAPNRLGALNHCRLTLEALESRQVLCCGVVLNHLEGIEMPAQQTNHSVLELVLNQPVFQVTFGQSDLTALAAQLGLLSV